MVASPGSALILRPGPVNSQNFLDIFCPNLLIGKATEVKQYRLVSQAMPVDCSTGRGKRYTAIRAFVIIRFGSLKSTNRNREFNIGQSDLPIRESPSY